MMKKLPNVGLLIKYKHNWKIHTNATKVCATILLMTQTLDFMS